jgi:hypothetical protein
VAAGALATTVTIGSSEDDVVLTIYYRLRRHRPHHHGPVLPVAGYCQFSVAVSRISCSFISSLSWMMGKRQTGAMSGSLKVVVSHTTPQNPTHLAHIFHGTETKREPRHRDPPQNDHGVALNNKASNTLIAMVGFRRPLPILQVLQLMMIFVAGMNFLKMELLEQVTIVPSERIPNGLVPQLRSRQRTSIKPSSTKNRMDENISNQTEPTSVTNPCRGLKTLEKALKCHRERAPYSSQIRDPCQESKINVWKDVERCINDPSQRHSFPSGGIREKHIHLIGERNSGTKWATKEIQRCFPEKEYKLKIHRDFLRPKHWFQPIREVSASLRGHSVVSIFRDPVEWVAAMIEKPYHMLNHMNGFDENYKPIPLDWEDFVSRSWTMPNRTEFDWSAIKANTTGEQRCRFGFKFQEVMPCRWANNNNTLPESVSNAHEPLYELRRDIKDSIRIDGVAFENILQLRSEKIKNHLLEVPKLRGLEGYLALRYEDLLMNGTRAMLESVATMLGLPGLPPKCIPRPPQPERAGHREIPDGLRQWVEDNMLLENERLLGYR